MSYYNEDDDDQEITTFIGMFSALIFVAALLFISLVFMAGLMLIIKYIC